MSNDNLICPICGEPTNVYMGKARRDRLCRKHGMLANKGELVQCEKCGGWNGGEESCKCKTVAKTVVKEPSKEQDFGSIIIDKGIRCIILLLYWMRYGYLRFLIDLRNYLQIVYLLNRLKLDIFVRDNPALNRYLKKKCSNHSHGLQQTS